jgi:hypothetical protein
MKRDIAEIVARAEKLEQTARATFPSDSELGRMAGTLVRAARAVSEAVDRAIASAQAPPPERPPTRSEASIETRPVPGKPDAGHPAGAGSGSRQGGTTVVTQVLGAPAAPEHATEKHLAESLSSLERVVESQGLSVDRDDIRFARKAADVIESLDREELTSAKGIKVLVDCVRFMDVLDRDYRVPGYEALGRQTEELKASLAGFLFDTHKLVFVPDPRVAGSAEPHMLGGLPGARLRNYPSGEPAGTPLALYKRGVRLGSGAEPAEVLASAGRMTPAIDLSLRTADILLRPADLPRELREARGSAAKDIRWKYVPELIDADRDKEATVLRYVANAVQAVNRAWRTAMSSG